MNIKFLTFLIVLLILLHNKFSVFHPAAFSSTLVVVNRTRTLTYLKLFQYYDVNK